MTGIRLVAIWREKEEIWYIVKEGSNRENMKNAIVVDKLTPRQFQGALENGQYSFAW
jgi:hypothetical protein